MDEKKYFPYLDLLKIVAALMVTFYHLAFYQIDYGTIANSGAVFKYIPNVNRIAMSACCISVPLFFMCSGVQTLAKERTIKYCGLKALKIILLTCIWYYTGFPAWFFITLTALYIVTPLIQYFYNKLPILIYIGLICLLICPFIYDFVLPIIKLVNIGAPNISILGFNIDVSKLEITGLFTSYAVLYYCLGYFLSKKKIKFELPIGIVLAIIGWAMAIIEVVINIKVSGKMFDGVNDSFQSLSALVMTTGVFLIAKNTKINEKIVSIVKKISRCCLPIYLLHSLIIRLLSLVWQPDSMNLLIAVSLTVLIDATCIGIALIIEKIPYVNKLIKI